MSEVTITISLKEYNDLLEDSLKLECFTRYGVDNWEGFSGAMIDFYELKKEYDEVF